MRKIPKKKGGKRVFYLVFLDPSFPGTPNSFMVKKHARLGELTTSGLSFSSLGRAATVPK
ncbi:hypothetical protein HKD37_13G035349 [Glycine soja]